MLNHQEVRSVGFLILEGDSVRSIIRNYPVSDRTVKRLKAAMENASIGSSEWMTLSDEERMTMCYPQEEKPKKTVSIAEDEFESIYQKIERGTGHYNVKAGWISYRKKYGSGIGYTRFLTLYRKWEDKAHPGRMATAPVYRKPGKYLFIDWIGDQPALVRSPKNPEKKVKAHFLVFTIGYSSLTFAAAFPNEKMPTVIEGINAALEYMGALPQAFRPDNMKTAVTSNTKDGLVLSSAMEDLQNYYGVPVLPTRPLKPKDKSSVERAVLILEQELLPELENQLFESFEDLNNEILKYINELNIRVKTGETLSRRELFEKYDLPNMKTLPPRPFLLREYRKLKVQRNCHVKLNGVYYSAPFQHVGEEVIVKISDQTLEICDANNQPICEHRTDIPSHNPYVTNPAHLKSCYQKQREVDERGISYYYDRAAQRGPNFKTYLERIVANYPFEEQSYLTCEGILQAAAPYSSSAIEEVADECMTNGRIGYSHFKNALKKKADLRNVKSCRSEEKEESSRNHSNIRGKEYYK